MEVLGAILFSAVGSGLYDYLRVNCLGFCLSFGRLLARMQGRETKAEVNPYLELERVLDRIHLPLTSAEGSEFERDPQRLRVLAMQMRWGASLIEARAKAVELQKVSNG